MPCMEETISCRARCGLAWFPVGSPSDVAAADVDWYQLTDREFGSCGSDVGSVGPLSDTTSNGTSLMSDLDNTATDDSPMPSTSTGDVQAT